MTPDRDRSAFASPSSTPLSSTSSETKPTYRPKKSIVRWMSSLVSGNKSTAERGETLTENDPRATGFEAAATVTNRGRGTADGDTGSESESDACDSLVVSSNDDRDVVEKERALTLDSAAQKKAQEESRYDARKPYRSSFFTVTDDDDDDNGDDALGERDAKTKAPTSNNNNNNDAGGVIVENVEEGVGVEEEASSDPYGSGKSSFF